jgi:hypothetical protein
MRRLKYPLPAVDLGFVRELAVGRPYSRCFIIRDSKKLR